MILVTACIVFWIVASVVCCLRFGMLGLLAAIPLGAVTAVAIVFAACAEGSCI